MFDHLSLGVSSLASARRFYDAALAPLGYRLLQEYPTMLGYGAGQAGLWLMKSAHPVPADERSGLHFCFAAPNRAAVDAFHKAALKAGGEDNGAPGIRPEYSGDYYAAFVTDPDGYRLEAYCGK